MQRFTYFSFGMLLVLFSSLSLGSMKVGWQSLPGSRSGTDLVRGGARTYSAPERGALAIPSISAMADGSWDTRFTFGLLDGHVYALLPDGAGGFYAGGSFTGAGGVQLAGIAHWDGMRWNALGKGFWEGSTVYALAMGPDGVLYAGGEFTWTGSGARVNSVARWDGSTWSALGDGISHTIWTPYVYTLATDAAGNLYAGGFFNRAGGVPVSHVARWNGVSWEALNDGFDGEVYALAVTTDGTLYAGGEFEASGANSLSYIAQWDGSNWAPMGDGMDGRVTAIRPAPQGGIYVTGWFEGSWNDDGPVMTHGIAWWDGANWSALGGGLTLGGAQGTGRTMATGQDGSLYVGGRFDMAGSTAAANVARWDGVLWQSLGEGTSGSVYALSTGPAGALLAGGAFSSAGGTLTNGLAAWNGNAWSHLGDVGDGINGGVVALSPDGSGGIYAGGFFQGAGDKRTGPIAHWNGDGWSALGEMRQGTVSYLLPDDAGGVYVATLSPAGLFHWDGQSWQNLGDPAGGSFGLVYALGKDAAGHLYAGGLFTHIREVTAHGIARWDGSTWSALADDDSFVTAMTVAPDGTIYAAGSIRSGGQLFHLARWDGQGWTGIGAAANNTVRVLSIGPDGALYAGGMFTQIGGAAASTIARWDGSTWSALGGGLTGIDYQPRVHALAFDDEHRLYAGGVFASAGGLPAEGVARWDGTAWESLSSGIGECCVFALAFARAAELWVGGAFTEAGGHESVNIARWRGTSSIRAEPTEAWPGHFALSPAYPNPFQLATTTELYLDRPQSVRVEAFDAHGRQVATLHHGPMLAGRHSLRFDALDLPNGLYIVRAWGQSASATRHIILLR